jgi:hypothetical protein
VFPFIMLLAFTGNRLTGSWRQLQFTTPEAGLSDLLDQEARKEPPESHFRHMLLLSNLIQKRVDDPAFGGLYNATPVVGDLLIIIPRVLYPAKPITTMEVVNSVALGQKFEALDRGKHSVDTASLWVQLYLLGGTAGMLPLAFAFAFGSFLVWNWAFQRRHYAPYLVATAVLWVAFGWLSFNVVFTTMELPGMLLGIVLVRFFFPAKRIADAAQGAEPAFSGAR